MRALLRENVAVIIGITLPMVVVLLFVLATELPKLFVEPPRHELLLVAQMSRQYERPVRLEIATTEGQLRVRAFKLEPQQGFVPFYPVPRLFVWSPAAHELREIEIVVPDDLDTLDDGAQIPVPELAARPISTALRSPDGYEFRRTSRSGAGIFGMLFGGGSQRLVIEKSGATVTIEPPSDASIWSVEFLGWIID
jgi:hypothetical protein